MALYFQGRKHLGSFDLNIDERTDLSCDIYERWEDIDCSATARCNNEGECSVTKSEGVSEKTSKTIEDAIEGSIGIEGLLSLKASSKEIVGKEVNWSYNVAKSQLFRFKAPKCGRVTLIIYQLIREYEISYSRKKLFGSDENWDRFIREETNSYDGLPEIDEFDELCNCKNKNSKKYDGRLCFNLGTISFRSPYRLTNNGVELQFFDKIVSLEFTDYSPGFRKLETGFKMDIPVGFIPPPLVFLGSLTGDVFNAEVNLFRDKVENVYEALESVQSVSLDMGVSITQQANHLESDS